MESIGKPFIIFQSIKKSLPMILISGVVIGVIVTQGISELSLILIISFPIFLLSLYLMHETIHAFNIRRMTIPAFWYLTYLFMIYFPSFVVFYQSEDTAKYAYLFAVQSVMITIPLGVLTVNKCYQFKSKSIDRFFTEPVQEGPTKTHQLLIYSIFLLFAVIIVLLYLSSLENIPLFHMIQHPKGTSQEFEILREESFKLLDPRWEEASSTSVFYLYLFLRTLGFPFLILVSMGYYLCSKDGRWMFLFLITLMVGALYAGASIARAPVAALILRMSFLIYLFKKGILGKKMIAVLIVLTLLFPVVVTKMGYGTGTEFVEALKRVAIRLFYTPAADLYDYFEIFPYHHDYLYGQALLKPIQIALRMDYFYIENYVYRYKFPGSTVDTGHSNAAFQSNLHADFGVIGVLLGGFLIGMMMQGIQIYIFQRRKTVVNLAMYSFMLYAFWVLNSGSITSVLFVNGVIPFFFLLMMFKGTEQLFLYLWDNIKAV